MSEISTMQFSKFELLQNYFIQSNVISIGMIGAIVADIGSFATRIGYAGDDLPRAYFPTVSQKMKTVRTQ